jgi:hypothetical protein
MDAGHTSPENLSTKFQKSVSGSNELTPSQSNPAEQLLWEGGGKGRGRGRGRGRGSGRGSDGGFLLCDTEKCLNIC